MSESRFAELISKIAHELRSPLTSVKGFSATLLNRWDRFDDEQRKQLVETIHADAERMGRIVSEVLDLARIESNRIELHMTDVPLAELCAEAAQSSASLGGSERVTIDVPADLVAHIDRERMLHVFGNVIENAIKFSDEGPIAVTGSSTGGQVAIIVSDEGVGIESERVPDIFSGPAPTSQKATPRGTGLGLYLSRRLVELHDGDISVESKEGEGSTFTVRLPAARA